MKPKGNDLKKILNDHSNWILSHGKMGRLADFTNRNLDKVHLEMANLPFAKLHNISLRSANLAGVNFRQAELLNVNLIDSDLDNANCEGANLLNSDLSFSNCIGANFADANLEGANFEGADLSETNFARAMLRDANFKNADLALAVMVDAKIGGANFEGALLSETNFTRAMLRNANFKNANLYETKFIGAILRDANFEGIDLEDTVLDKANFEGADLEGTVLDEANFEETYLKDFNGDNSYLLEDDFSAGNFFDQELNEITSYEADSNNHNFDKTTKKQRSSINSLKEDLFVDSNGVDPGMIEKAFIDLIEKIKSNIQLDQLKAICKQQHGIEKIDKIEFEQGDIIPHDGQVACRLDFKISISYNLSLLLDRKGKLIKKSDLKA